MISPRDEPLATMQWWGAKTVPSAFLQKARKRQGAIALGKGHDNDPDNNNNNGNMM